MFGDGLGMLFLCAALAYAQESSSPIDSNGVEEAHFGTTVVVASGLKGEIYFLEPDTFTLPKRFERLKLAGTVYTNGVYIPPRDFSEGFPGISKRTEWFAIDYTGRFYVDKPGKYTFALISDDGSKLSIDGKMLIDNDGIHAPLRMDSTTKLEGGLHTIRLSYFQGPRFQLCLMLGVWGPGDKNFRAFNMNDFKPPSNPEDWKYGSPSDMDKLDPKATVDKKKSRK